MCEEDLGIGCRLMGEKYKEARLFFVKNCAEGEIDLWKAGGSSLSNKSVAQSHV